MKKTIGLNFFKNIDFEALEKKGYEESTTHPNNLSFWFPKIEQAGFAVPDTCVIPLDFDRYSWMRSEGFAEKDIEAFNVFILDSLQKRGFDTNRKLFIKTGVFSDKFTFSSCSVTNLADIGKQFLSIWYSGALMGADRTAELVVREFIETTGRKTIYGGMPLNTEFRVFYDFDQKKIMGTVNYWDRQVMTESLGARTNNPEGMKDVQHFAESIDAIEAEFEYHKEELEQKVSQRMKEVDLTGKWSIDFMKAGDTFYLIDMALAHQSYYYDQVKEQTK